MSKVAIIGNAGGGKSALARRPTQLAVVLKYAIDPFHPFVTRSIGA